METRKIEQFLFDRTVTPDLELSMDAYSKRQKLIANNIANAETPGYQAKEISFEEQYKKLIDRDRIRGIRSQQGHRAVGGPLNLQDVKLEPEVMPDRTNTAGSSNVDIEHEMVELAKNNMRYELSTTAFKKLFTNLRNAIKGR